MKHKKKEEVRHSRHEAVVLPRRLPFIRETRLRGQTTLSSEDVTKDENISVRIYGCTLKKN